MMQEIGFAFVGVGLAGMVAVLAFNFVPALRRDPGKPGAIRIDEKNLLQPAGALPDVARPAARRAIAQAPAADELFSELFALRAEVAALTEDVRSMRKQLEAPQPREATPALASGQPHAAA
jgi:hypothetical protein